MHEDVIYYEKNLQRSVMGSNRFRINTPRYVAMYLDPRPDLDDLITGRLDVEEINGELDAMRTGRIRRNLIVLGEAHQ